MDGVPFEWVEDSVPLKDLTTFFAEHRVRLIALVRKAFRDYSWLTVGRYPEDVVQDTMVSAVRNWPRIGWMANPDAYLRKVAAKKATRAMVKASREMSVSAEGFLSLFDDVLVHTQERSPSRWPRPAASH
ncbi:RNA polymerase sigma factor [Streptomyces sp. NPDC017940]|uniref:RNA polymerase sigma factor n=1 Tax=Streptomyces sp. NPDC017940 TaxID=3365017 RepID=UPI0037B162D5